MKKTLGGQRLGSGNKMEVEMHGFERSSHDMGYIWRSTMSSGTLVPFLKEVALPGDTFDIHLNCDIKTHPTVGPLFGSYKVQLDIFQVPVRLYHSALHNNKLGIGMNIKTVKLPKVVLPATQLEVIKAPDPNNAQISPSSIFSYLGIRGVGSVDTGAGVNQSRPFNAIPWLAYWEIYKNYYANKQEEIGYVISKATTFALNKTITAFTANGDAIAQRPASSNVALGLGESLIISYTGAAPDIDTVKLIFWGFPPGVTLRQLAVGGTWADSGTQLFATYDFAQFGNQIALGWDYISADSQLTTPPELVSFPLENIDIMRETILKQSPSAELLIPLTSGTSIAPYMYPMTTVNISTGKDFVMMQCAQEGLAIKTYQSDLFNNWLSTEWLDGTGGINEITAVDTSSGSFNIDALVLSKKVWDMLQRIAVSGGSYDDWLEAVYDHNANRRAESPVYMGGLIKELTFQEVVSNSQATGADGTQPLGTLAGKGIMGQKHKGGTVVVKVDEPSYIIGIVSLTPRIDYSQGNKWDVHLDTMDDFHKPNLDQIGFQELITEQMAWWDTHKETSGGEWIQMSAGKQPAWINYMTNVNEVRGNFAGNESFMVLQRNYEPYEIAPGILGIKDLTTYIDPSKYNNIFAQTSLDAQNFWTQISIDMTARRKMSAKIMPNL
ncbi:MAG: major capsid protein [Microviridae sp.]|nr:MAG: major capsid protein [Microviridae sp.]